MDETARTGYVVRYPSTCDYSSYARLPERVRVVDPVRIDEKCEYCGRKRRDGEPCRGCGHD